MAALVTFEKVQIIKIEINCDALLVGTAHFAQIWWIFLPMYYQPSKKYITFDFNFDDFALFHSHFD